MKKLDLGQTIGVLANLGVIAGIVFLGVELHQNNLLLEEQSRYSMLENQKDWTFFVTGDEEVARLVFDSPELNELTELERHRRVEILLSILFSWQWEYQQSLSGFLTHAEVPIEAYRSGWKTQSTDSVWQSNKTQFSPEFAVFVEENVRN